MGTGHLMRCMSLAQGWRSIGGDVSFICAEITPALEARLLIEGFSTHRLSAKPGTCEDVYQTLAIVRDLRASAFNPKASATWIVVDGYQFDADFQWAIKAAGSRLLVFDDFGHAAHYSADIVLNQNLNADENLYANREPYTLLLLGAHYILLRQQFFAYRDRKREIRPLVRRVLVTLGGSDPDNVTSKVIEALDGWDIEAKLVIGGSNPHLETLGTDVRRSKFAVELVVDANNMPELMTWADVAITAGGTTAWELAFMGVPMLVVLIAATQRNFVASIGAAQLAHITSPDRIAESLPAFLSNTDDRRQMSLRGQKLVDGYGVERVVAAVAEQTVKLAP